MNQHQATGRVALTTLSGRSSNEIILIGRLSIAFDVLQMYGCFISTHDERQAVVNVFVNTVQMQQAIAEQLEGQGMRLEYDQPNEAPPDADVATCFKIGQHDFLVQEMRLIKRSQDENRIVSHAMKFFERLTSEIDSTLESLKDANDFPPAEIWAVTRKQLRKPLDQAEAHVLGLAVVDGKEQPVLVRMRVDQHKPTDKATITA